MNSELKKTEIENEVIKLYEQSGLGREEITDSLKNLWDLSTLIEVRKPLDKGTSKGQVWNFRANICKYFEQVKT